MSSTVVVLYCTVLYCFYGTKRIGTVLLKLLLYRIGDTGSAPKGFLVLSEAHEENFVPYWHHY